MPSRRKRVQEDCEPTYGERHQRLINMYHDGHFHMIEETEKILKECQKQFKQVEDPKLKKSYESMIKRTEKDLLVLQNKTEFVLKETARMQKNLDSLK